jgi:hypothetical protein
MSPNFLAAREDFFNLQSEIRNPQWVAGEARAEGSVAALPPDLSHIPPAKAAQKWLAMRPDP